MRLAGSAPGETAAELLEFFGRPGADDTLGLLRAGQALFTLFEDGSVKLQREVTDFGHLSGGTDSFSWHRHERNQLPLLPSALPAAGADAFRALPGLGTEQPLPTVATDLPGLLKHLRQQEFSGVLTLKTDNDYGLAVFTDGLARAAAFERDGYIWERVDGLRALQRHSLQPGEPPLQLLELDRDTALSLAGVLLDARAGSDALTDYSGVTASDGSFVFFLSGQPYLQVRTPVLVPGVRYAQPDEDNLPDLRLPSGRPGWEDQRFDLTLRGRDALIPMTVVAMEFDAKHGTEGRRLLELLEEGLSAEEAAARLRVDLSTMQDGLEALVEDGLIRAGK